MKRLISVGAALILGAGLFCTTPGFAQPPQAVQKIQEMIRPLNLTAQQKEQLIPILRAELPRIEAVKSNTSLTGMQKVQQLRAIHAETDPQVRAILTPDQYQQLQAIRQQEIQQAIKRKMGQQ